MKFLSQCALPTIAVSTMLFVGVSSFQSLAFARIPLDKVIFKGEQVSPAKQKIWTGDKI